MKHANRRYNIELGGALIAYTVVLFISQKLLGIYTAGPLRIALALAPMIPACFIPVVVVRLLARIDELQRRIQLEALGFAFGGTAVITFAYGFLENAGFPSLSWFLIWPIMAVLWLIGITWATLRYR